MVPHPPAAPQAASQRPVQKPAGRCIVVFGTKGGVGKTVVATNLAASFAQRIKQPVALVDLDMHAVNDACKMLNVVAHRSIADLMPVLKRATAAQSQAMAQGEAAGGAPAQTGGVGGVGRIAPVTIPLEDVMVPHASGIHVLTCFSNPRQIGQVDPQALPVLFEALKQRYAYVVVDGGKALAESLIAAFDAADLILLVVSPDVITLYQTKWALGLIESLLFPVSMVKAVLNRAESLGGVNTKDARVAISCEIIGQIPSDGQLVGTSVNQGVPLVSAFASSKVAAAFLRLAEVLTTQQDLYVAHHEIPRHRQAKQAVESPVPGSGSMWSTKLYATEEWAGQDESAVDEIVLLKRRIHERLVQELDLKKQDFGAIVQSTQMAELRHKTERVIANLLAREVGGLASSHEVRARLVKEIADEALGLGPLEELLADPEISDILVNNKDQIYVERAGKLELTTRKFVSNDLVRAVIERIIAPLGRRIDESSPMVDARLPDGSRVNAIIPPLSLKGPALSIRKFARTRYTEKDLIQFGSLTPAMIQFIKACVAARKNMIISGGTGSGKTTLLNIVSTAISEGERIITIEDAAELQLAQTHWLSLEARSMNVEGKGQVTIRDLFHNVLRMRPDRIIVGECRGAETLDMLQAMNTGHHGSITTVHANSPRDAVTRLDSMVLMSNIELPIRAIREMIASAIDVIIHTSRLSDGTRKIVAISELVDLVNGTDILFQDLFVFRQTGVAPDGTVLGDFVMTGKPPTFIEELKIKGIEFDASIFTPSHGSPACEGGEEVAPIPKGASPEPRLSSRGTGFTLEGHAPAEQPARDAGARPSRPRP